MTPGGLSGIATEAGASFVRVPGGSGRGKLVGAVRQRHRISDIGPSATNQGAQALNSPSSLDGKPMDSGVKQNQSSDTEANPGNPKTPALPPLLTAHLLSRSPSQPVRKFTPMPATGLNLSR